MSKQELYMSVDAETMGLHGGLIAIGYLVVDAATGKTLAEDVFCCPIENVKEAPGRNGEDRAWVERHVVPALAALSDLLITLQTSHDVRERLWVAWRHWSSKGARFLADCCWPVEARFLAACVDDAKDGSRNWAGPYPLLDIAPVLVALGEDPLYDMARLPDELPAHNPLCDARQSARLWLETLKRVRRHACLRARVDACPEGFLAQIEKVTTELDEELEACS